MNRKEFTKAVKRTIYMKRDEDTATIVYNPHTRWNYAWINGKQIFTVSDNRSAYNFYQARIREGYEVVKA